MTLLSESVCCLPFCQRRTLIPFTVYELTAPPHWCLEHLLIHLVHNPSSDLWVLGTVVTVPMPSTQEPLLMSIMLSAWLQVTYLIYLPSDPSQLTMN